jgi:hypothetical protein
MIRVRLISRGFAAAALSILSGAPQAAAPAIPDGMLDGLSWRLIGPFRAGWSTVAAGDPQAKQTYYFGAAGGGIWKSIDAGRTWTPIFDDGPASIGALAVAPSDPKRIYAGTGQVTSRYDIAAGAGVFSSKDGGATWKPSGLEATRHIGAILVDPRSADVVLVAAFGHAFAANPERGVFRSEDGGATRVYGVVQELGPGELPETLSGYYYVENWEQGTPKQYLQFVVIVTAATNIPQQVVDLNANNHQVRYILAGVDSQPTDIANSRYVMVSTEQPAVGRWVRFERNVRQGLG